MLHCRRVKAPVGPHAGVEESKDTGAISSSGSAATLASASAGPLGGAPFPWAPGTAFLALDPFSLQHHVFLTRPMSGSRKHSSYPSESEIEPYHDDPIMGSAADATRSPALNSPDGHDSERPPLLSIRSSVPLMPTPGTTSQRNPTYVGPSSCFALARWMLIPLCRNRSCCASGSSPRVACYSALWESVSRWRV